MAVGKYIDLGSWDLGSQLLAQMHHHLQVEVRDAHTMARPPGAQHSSQPRQQHPLKLSVQLMSV
jgi:hypothetical protein